jgi:phosphoribosylglycinamide formyltransferase 1
LSTASKNKISFVIALTAVVLRMTQLAIFASGTGTNARNIIHHFRHHPHITVSLIVCNKPGAGVLQIAGEEGIPWLLIEKEPFFRGTAYVPELRERGIDFIILAGFLWKIPEALIKAYPRRIINIHPALLPKHGGKGMYGRFVHEAVIAASDKETGITIHYVDEQYDHGDPIFQARVPVEPGDDPGTLARKVQFLEYQHFPQVIEEAIKLQNQR